MSQIYLYEPDGNVRLNSGQLLTETPGSKCSGTPTGAADGLIIAGNATITTPAVRALLEQKKMIVLTNTVGKPYAYILPLPDSHALLRHRQHLAYQSEQRILLAKLVLTEKLEAEKAVIRAFSYRNPHINWERYAELHQRVMEQLAVSTDVPSLLGLEGRMAAHYFQCIQMQLKGNTRQRGRNASDPFNALLNLGYTIYTNQIVGMIQALGMDPALGYLHSIQDSRPSLACDCLEPIRSAIDCIVIKTLNLGQISAEDFEWTGSGLRLLPKPFKKYLDILMEDNEERLNQARGLLDFIVHQLQQGEG